MTRRCSHCSNNGHNSRTCPSRVVRLFGVRLTDGSIKKSASMGNLTHYTGSNNPGSSPDPSDPPAVADGYASDDLVQASCSSNCRERKKGGAGALRWAKALIPLLGCLEGGPLGANVSGLGGHLAPWPRCKDGDYVVDVDGSDTHDEVVDLDDKSQFAI
ncbi:hypothetical protein AMTR_s00056p00127760 [Amborella trichopoda]|uniref:Uncharacterized protein n=1 Tax=Amborella trichopoda TaxID=13333 RepID=U5CPQ5_AMBTC|nr:hypothetical protein AMTR_s00056p00127760 [Amborella trichopoda]